MPITPGKYYIKNAMAWTVMDEATDGTHLVHGWHQLNLPNQQWLVQRVAGGYTLKNLGSQLYAHADGAYNDCKIRGDKHPTVWCLPQEPEGFVYITFPNTNFVVDLDMGKEEDGTIIHLWEKSGAPQQRWYFERICN